MSVIILEGCDKTGKTTLAKRLSEVTGYNIIKCSAPEGDPYIEYVSKLFNVDNVIFDRFCYGELVYGPIYRKKSQLSDVQLYNIELLLQARDAQLIYCYADQDFIVEKFKTEDETFAKEEDINQILLRYDDVVKNSRIKVSRHKIPTESFEAPSVSSVSHVLINSQYVGSLTPDVVFVGEKNNLNAMPKYKEFSLPFDFGRSSTILRKLIKDVGLTSYGMTNAFKHHLPSDQQASTLRAEFDALKPRVVVALGNVAAKALKEVDVKHVVMWHPSFLGRFKGAQRADYLTKLQSLCSN